MPYFLFTHQLLYFLNVVTFFFFRALFNRCISYSGFYHFFLSFRQLAAGCDASNSSQHDESGLNKKLL